MDSHGIDIDQLLANEPWLRRLASALVAPADVDDLVQQTLSSAITNPPRSEGLGGGHNRLRAWLGGVARNLARQTHRTKQRRLRRERAAARDEALPSTAQMLERLDAHRKLTEVVRQLEEPYRSTLLLRYYEELPAPEIAQRLGVPPSTVRTRIERGLTRLRDRLDARSLTGLLGVILSRPPAPETAAIAAAGSGTALAGGAFTMTVAHKFAIATLPILAIGLGYWLSRPTTGDPLGPRTGGGTPSVARATPDAADSNPGRTAVDPVASATHAPGKTAPELLGKVVDPLGRPLHEVPIFRFAPNLGIDETFSVDLSGHRGKPVGKSDDEGEFATDPTDYRGVLSVGEPFVGLASYNAARNQGESLIVAARSASVRGTVVDPSGVPVADAKVFAIVESLLDYPGDLSATSRIGLPRQDTDRLGQFVLDRVPHVRELELRVFCDGYAEAREYDVLDRSPLTIKLRKKSSTRPYRLTGTVVDERDQPVPGALIRFGGIERKSNRNGVFRLSSKVLGKSMRLIVAKAGHQPIECPQVVERMLAGSPQIDGLRLRLGPAPLTITGRVVTPDGKPIEGLAVSLLDTLPLEGFQSAENLAAARDQTTFAGGKGQSDFAEAHTDEDGRFTIHGLRDAPYRFRVFDDETLISKTIGPVRPDSAPVPVVFDPNAARYTLRGTTKDSMGRALAGIRVSITLCTREAGATLNSYGPSTLSDEHGVFELTGIPPGDCRLQASGDGVCDLARPADPLRGSGEVPLVLMRRCRIRLEVGDGISGRVELLDGSGEPLELSRRHGSISMSGVSWTIERGRTPVLSVSEAAAECIVRREGEVVLRQPIRLDAERLTVIRSQ